MDHCDCCGKKIDERAMQEVEGTEYYVCNSCLHSYTNEELIEKIEEENEKTL